MSHDYERVLKTLESIHLTQLYFQSFKDKSIDDLSLNELSLANSDSLLQVISNEDHRLEFIASFNKLSNVSNCAGKIITSAENKPVDATEVILKVEQKHLESTAKGDDRLSDTALQSANLTTDKIKATVVTASVNTDNVKMSQSSEVESFESVNLSPSKNASGTTLKEDSHSINENTTAPQSAKLLKDLRWIRDLIITHQQDLIRNNHNTKHLDEWLKRFHTLEHDFGNQSETVPPAQECIEDFGVLLDDLVLTSLAKVFHDKGDYRSSLRLLEIIYDRHKSTLGPEHLDTLKSQFRIASCLGNLKEYCKALEMYRFVYKKKKEILGIHHEDTLRALYNIALISQGQERYSEAIKLYEKLYNRRNSSLGSSHPLTLDTQFQRALCLANLEQYNHALELFKFVYEKYKDIFGPNHAETLATQNNIAVILVNQEKYSDALAWYVKVYEVEVHELGPEHPHTLNTKENMKRVSEKIED